MSGDSNGSSDSGCTENSAANGGRKCSLLITDELNEVKPRRPVRRDSHLFNNTSTSNGDVAATAATTNNSSRQSYAMQKRLSMRPTVPTLPEVE